MKKYAFHTAFVLGGLAVLWVAAGVAATHPLVLAMTAVIGVVFGFGALELHRYRVLTVELQQALGELPHGLQDLADWLPRVPAALQSAVRQRIEGDRIHLPGPALTPYLVGLLVMLGMLGTFLGMVVTLNGAVFALEGTSSVQGMRAAFSEPIRGLGLAFGTSVAGVATSAMLGLMSSLSRGERALVAQTLDKLTGTDLRRFSLTHQRQQTLQALQQQTQTLPVVVEQLQSLMAQMERHSLQIGERLLTHQENFHRHAQTAYSELARSVDQSLRSSLSQSMQVASEGIRPVVQATLTDMSRQAQTMHERMLENAREQWHALHQQFSNTSTAVAQTWSGALGQHEQASADLLRQMGQTLGQLNETLSQRTETLLASVRTAQAEQQARQDSAERERLDTWKASLQEMNASLQIQWQTAGSQTLAQQQQICETLAQTAQAITAQVQGHASQSLADITRLMDVNEELTRARIAAESAWLAQHAQKSEELMAVLRGELAMLRAQEAERGDAAVARLTALQEAVARHLTTLGTSLEGPITRLIATASEAPKAAAEVIGQMRQEISVSVARDNALLEERARILGTLGTLLDAINHASSEQRAVIDALVSSSKETLAQASQDFQTHVTAETDKLDHMAAQVTASAVDVASLGETFGFAVRSFNETNEKLMATLQRIEAAMAQSMARSDEQLAYYVAQARELIDLSIGSQKEVLEALQQRQTEGAT